MMHKGHHKITFHAILGGFIAVSLLLISYSFVASGEEGRTAFKNRLSEQLLRTQAADETARVTYLTPNVDIPPPVLGAAASLVWDSASSTPLWEHSARDQRPIASITKLMTAAVVSDTSRMDEPVVISDTAVETIGEAGSLRAGEALTVEALLQALLLESSNDAAVALAEHVEEYTGKNFVTLMNAKALSFGMSTSRFQDSAGLIDEGAYSTARDLVTLLDRLRTRPEYRDIWDILAHPTLTTFSADGQIVHSFANTNPFLEELAGVVGGKTGYTHAAGESMVLVVSSPDGSRELYYIVLGSDDRFRDMRTLINWVSSAYVWE